MLCRKISFPILFILLSVSGWAQQFREGGTSKKPFAKNAIERHLQSLHPQLQPGRQVPGKYLLQRPPIRAEQLNSRISATTAAKPRMQGSVPGVLPGIHFRPNIPTGSLADSVVSGDFNRDGRMDFIVANGGTNDLWIYLGKGDGSFELPRVFPLTRGQTPVAMVTADLRGNGILDLIVAEYDTWSIGVLLGKGDGTFAYEQIYYTPQPPGAVVVDDFNHDGKLDISCVMDSPDENHVTNEYIATLLGDGAGAFATPVISANAGLMSTADSIVSGDVNNDGLPDLLITDPGQNGSQVYTNLGNGVFTPGFVVEESGPFNVPMAGALADTNGDGCADALVADLSGFTWLAPGDCKGNFPAGIHIPMGDSSSQLSLVDINGDGHLDIVTTSIAGIIPTAATGDIAGNNLCVSFGDGRGNFTPGRVYVGTGQSYSLAVADFNGDGKLDVVTASPDTDSATVYLNDGSGGYGFPQGSWAGVPSVAIINAPVSPISFSDVNHDGKPDLLLLDEGLGGEYLITALLNDGTGRFSGPVQSDSSLAITSNRIGDFRLADFRNTGQQDFVAIGLSTAYSTGAQFILFAPGNGDGSFGRPTFLPTPGADGEIATGDFNRDGKLDFAAVGPLASTSGKAVTMFLGNGDGTFHNASSTTFADTAGDISRVLSGDFNRDGKLDLLVYTTSNGYAGSTYVWEFLGNGDGTFKPAVQLFSALPPVILADLNGDSWLDLISYGEATTPGFTNYLDQPSGTFLRSSSYAPYAGVSSSPKPYLQLGDPSASSLVSDLNGDTKPDEIVFQHVSASNFSTYAQVLMGNGDGTFTPTYDVFNFNKDYSYPYYAHDLDGDGISDLVELDGGTSSLHVFRGGPAPSFQLELQPAQITGNSGCGWVFLNVPSASDSVVALSSAVPGVLLPASVTVPANFVSQQFCFTLASNFDWHNVFDIRAQLGPDTAVAYGSQSYVFGFTEALSSSAAQVVYPTQSSKPITVSLTSSQGYSSTVQMSCIGLPPGATCVFGSSTLHVSGTAVASTTVTVNTIPTTSGISTVQILASDSEVTARQSFSFTVQPLEVSAVPGLSAATSPGTATGLISILGIPPYKTSCAGLPAGVTCSFSGQQVPYPSFTDLTMTVVVPPGMATGSYPFTVAVVSGPQSASLGFNLNITDFGVQGPTAATDWAPPGGSMNVNLGLQGIAGFSGSVAVTCSLDFAGTCGGGTYAVYGSTPTPASLSVSVPGGAAVGTHTLSIVATSGLLSHAVSFPFSIADYSGSISGSSLTIPAGGSGSLNATINATAGFAGTVSFACTGAAQISCVFSPPAVQPTGGSSQSTSITLQASSLVSGVNVRIFDSAILGSILAVGLLFGLSSKEVFHRRNAVSGMALLILLAWTLSCGSAGGSGGGGGGGSTQYSVTIIAAANGTDTTRTIGTISVTVTH